MLDELEKLLNLAKTIEMTPAELEAQRQSFAFGNANIENELVTREMVAMAADSMRRGD